MAKKIKDLSGNFDFTGMLTKKELIIGEVDSSGNKKNDKLTLHIYDSKLDSVVKLDIWGGNKGRYWNNLKGESVEVTGTSAEISKKMKEVKDTRIGNPFSITLKGATTVEHYINNDVITALNKIPENKHVLNITGSLGYKQYKGRTYREYKISSIEINSKKPLGLNVTFPVVIPNISKDKFFFKDFPDNIPVLIKSKLEEGGTGYAPIEVRLDKNWVLNGQAIEVAKTANMELLTLVNDKLMTPMVNSMKQVKSDYVSAIVIGRLKTGEITKKPTLDSLNTMEKILLEMQGEQAIQDKLDSMELITEYFDSVYFGAFDIHDSKLFEDVSDSELKFVNDNNKNETSSNPMMDALNGVLNVKTEESNNFDFGAEPTEEVKDEVNSKDLATSEDLDALIAEAEKDVVTEADKKEEEDNSDFPF